MRTAWFGILGFATVMAACDGSMTVDDGGPPASGLVLTATGAAERTNINGVAPRMGFKYYLIDATVEARGSGPFSIAPFTFAVVLEDGTRTTADSRTNELADGCSSQSIPVDTTVMCRLAFLALVDAPAPATLVYDNDGTVVRASVPAL